MSISEQIKKIRIQDKNYPKALKKIENPPQILYYKGEIFENENCFAVVGTRRCSQYGKEVAFEIVKDLVMADLTIVSGLAPGIDTIAHQVCVEFKKRTIAVLGTGVDQKSIYPKSNLKLAREILNNKGCLLSEYNPGTHGSKFTFPQRNRIIAGLSLGVLVIEAREVSGAIITAQFGFFEKRPVFAIPGSIYNQTSKGCNWLIKKGAKLVENANDILKELNFPRTKSVKNFPSEKSLVEPEEIILNSISKGALNIDEIIKRTKLSPAKVASSLAILEIEGKVRNLGGNVFALRK